MIVLDANIVLYAYDTVPQQHQKARALLQSMLSANEPVGLPWRTISAFLRIMTNTRLPGQRFTPDEAAEIVNRWLERPVVRMLTPGDDHWSVFRQMVIDGQASGALISDAEIAALTIEYGGVLYTSDRDFSRFPGLNWKNPLV
ncbi:MAG: TA system VapC family ribonuclease toxin [Candidatus Sulfotelmatobacter sp.]